MEVDSAGKKGCRGFQCMKTGGREAGKQENQLGGAGMWSKGHSTGRAMVLEGWVLQGAWGGTGTSGKQIVASGELGGYCRAGARLAQVSAVKPKLASYQDMLGEWG